MPSRYLCWKVGFQESYSDPEQFADPERFVGSTAAAGLRKAIG
jgi:hypothetical protein